MKCFVKGFVEINAYIMFQKPLPFLSLLDKSKRKKRKRNKLSWQVFFWPIHLIWGKKYIVCNLLTHTYPVICCRSFIVLLVWWSVVCWNFIAPLWEDEDPSIQWPSKDEIYTLGWAASIFFQILQWNLTCSRALTQEIVS